MMEVDSELSMQDDDKPADDEDGDLEIMEEDSELDRVPEHVEESMEHKYSTHSVQDLGKPAAFEGPKKRKHQHLVQECMCLTNYRKRKNQVLDLRLIC
jgi:hypothetical protein